MSPADEGILAAKMDEVQKALKMIEESIKDHLECDDENTLSTSQLIQSCLETLVNFEVIK